jgi:hypothetical protein
MDIIPFEMGLESEIAIGLKKAQAACSARNKEMTPICARGAADFAPGIFQTPTRSGLAEMVSIKHCKHWLYSLISPHLKPAATGVMLRVNGIFGLSKDVDLILEAHKLIGELS